MKNILFISFFLISTSIEALAQLNVNYQPNVFPPFWHGQTVTFDYEYQSGTTPITKPAGCTESFSVQNNLGGTTNTTGLSGQKVNVTWGSQKSTNARVNITLENCTISSNNSIYPSSNYTILSITSETPASISGNSLVSVCLTTTALTYSTQPMQVPNSTLSVDGYEWTIPAGWKFADGVVSTGAPRLFQSIHAYSQNFTPDCKGAGPITVRGWTNAGGKGTPARPIPSASTRIQHQMS